MKKIILFASLLLLYSCKTGLITNQEKKGDYMFEKFDFASRDNNYKEYKKGNSEHSFFLKDGSEFLTVVYKEGCEMWILPPKPAFYTVNKVYYRGGIIKEKGKYFGKFDLGSTPIKIGVWTYFDEQGKVIREEDEDKKFGNFGYNELLTFLDQEKVINLRTGKNRENFSAFINYTELKGRKIWHVKVYTDKTWYKGVRYLLDFNTGALLMKYSIIGWENGNGTDYKFTKLIDNTAIYKTENGIDYTEPEWKEHQKNKEEGIYYYNNDDNNNNPNNTNYSLLIVLLILVFAVILGGFIYIMSNSRSLLQP
ncbi:hypothetical protein FNW52_09130 [Flavobacterium sp. ZT3R18]|uniref:hypothetical protein n=1 Tax=Flavobacterium sp. ZT3R18 TaxID=2594429 RepID=UPI00117A033C|nr:hypothetical protein [Flavobacterium sp. ZT3R18]TRX36178.1 hypothetical protein FNW52_09130 [Flavobacterium sp. ZT3R18]